MIDRLFRSVGGSVRKFLKSEKKHSDGQTAPEESVASSKSSVPDQTGREQVGEIKKADPDKGGTSESRPTRRRRRKPRPAWDLSMFQVESAPGKVRFHDFPLPEAIMHAIADLDFRYCTPVQEKALPIALDGEDLVGRANTGTGKTAVFLIAIFSQLLQEKQSAGEGCRPRALIIAPTRELVVQIAKDGRNLSRYTPLTIHSVFGGVNYTSQIQDLQQKRCDVVVATPGRLLDYIGKRILSLDDCAIMVIDEADRMLDMGFIPDVRRIIHRIPPEARRQTMLFSATVTDEVRRLAARWCKDPKTVEIEPEQVAVKSVDQIVYLVTTAEKYDVLYNMVQKNPGRRILVFTNQKNEARRLCERLKRNAVICNLLTGDVAQHQRSRRLEEFRTGKIPVLVATDVAGRGIHVEDVSYVVNFTLPYEPEDYVHRIGRTGRAGAAGTSISFACEEGSFYLPQIEDYIGQKLDCIVPNDDLLIPAPKQSAESEGQRTERRGRRKKNNRYRGPKRRRS